MSNSFGVHDDDGVALSGNKKALVLIVISGMIVVGGILAMLYREHLYNPKLVLVISFVAMLIFGGVFVYGIRMFLNHVPMVVVDKAGFVDNSNGPLSVGRVCWEQVDDIRLLKKHLQNLIVIYVKNPESFFKGHDVIRNAVFRSNFVDVGSPIVISGSSLDVGAHDAFVVIKSKFDDFLIVKNANA